MKIEEFVGKTIKTIGYSYGIHIEFTDGSELLIDSRYQGGLNVHTLIEETVTEKRSRYIEVDKQ